MAIYLFSSSPLPTQIYTSLAAHFMALLSKAKLRASKHTDSRGVPVFALAMSAAIATIAFLNVSSSSATLFGYLVNLVTIFGLLTWISILVSHICFIRAHQAQNVPDSALAFTAPLDVCGSYGALAMCILLAMTKDFTVFTRGTWGDFDYKNFVTCVKGNA